MSEHQKFLVALVDLQEAKVRSIETQIFEAAYLSQTFSKKANA